MISGVFGLPGSGKTTFLTHLALRALAGKPLTVGHLNCKIQIGHFDHYDAVFTTWPVDGCFQFRYEDTVGTFQYEHCLILIDEISHVQDNRDFKNYNYAKKVWWSTLRHSHIDLCYAGQNYNDVDKKVQGQTEQLFLIEARGKHKSRISPILPEQACKMGDIKTCYSLAPRLARSTLDRRKYYTAFDSYIHDTLPPVPMIPWVDHSADLPPSEPLMIPDYSGVQLLSDLRELA